MTDRVGVFDARAAGRWPATDQVNAVTEDRRFRSWYHWVYTFQPIDGEHSVRHR